MRPFDVPPGEGRLYLIRGFIGIVVVDEARACTVRCHVVLEAQKETTRCMRRSCSRVMQVLDGLRGRLLGRAWHLMIGPSIPDARILAGEERLPRSSRRATRSCRAWRGLVRDRRSWRRPPEGTRTGHRGLHVFETLRV